MSATSPARPATNPPALGPQKYFAEKHATSPAFDQRSSSDIGKLMYAASTTTGTPAARASGATSARGRAAPSRWAGWKIATGREAPAAGEAAAGEAAARESAPAMSSTHSTRAPASSAQRAY